MFIKLTDRNGKPIIINSEHVAYYLPLNDKDETYLQLALSGEDQYFYIQESPRYISSVLGVLWGTENIEAIKKMYKD